MLQEFALTSQERQTAEKERKDAQDERRAASQAREQDNDGWSRAQQERDGISFSAVALISLALQKEKILNWLSSADCMRVILPLEIHILRTLECGCLRN